MDLAEETRGRDQLVDGKLLKAYRDAVRLPNGQDGVREWIDHPGASAIVPVFEDGTTLLIRQYRYPAQQVCVEVPAGKIDEGQAPDETARRELEEETGWRAGELVRLGQFYPCIGYSNEVIYVYLARDLSEGSMELEDNEFIEPFRVSLQDALEMVRTGEIVDGKSMLALRMARDELNRG